MTLKEALYNMFDDIEGGKTTEIGDTASIIDKIGHDSIEGGRRAEDMVKENVMTGGTIEDDNGKPSYDSSDDNSDDNSDESDEEVTIVTKEEEQDNAKVEGGNFFEEIYENAPVSTTDVFNQIYEHDEDDDSSSDSSDSEEDSDSSDDIPVEDKVEDSDDPIEEEYVERYNNIIQQLRNTPLSINGGVNDAKPARRVRIINAYPYILKSQPTYQ